MRLHEASSFPLSSSFSLFLSLDTSSHTGECSKLWITLTHRSARSTSKEDDAFVVNSQDSLHIKRVIADTFIVTFIIKKFSYNYNSFTITIIVSNTKLFSLTVSILSSNCPPCIWHPPNSVFFLKSHIIDSICARIEKSHGSSLDVRWVVQFPNAFADDLYPILISSLPPFTNYILKCHSANWKKQPTMAHR